MTRAANGPPLLEIEDLSISYYTRAGEVPAVVDFSMRVEPGEAVGLVGESGCGKSTVAMAIMRYLGNNGAIVGGSIRFNGRDLTQLKKVELRAVRGSQIAMIYQEPMAALNPSMTLGEQLMEVPLYHNGASPAEARDRAIDMLVRVKLTDPGRLMTCYPHQVSGGQQQRVVIAMALLANPALLLLDEPTTALDVTVEAGIIELIAEIRETFGTGMVFISHNLGLVRETCARVCVMYSGLAVEAGAVGDLFERPRHPYTRGLMCCVAAPSADRFARPLAPIRGQLPLPSERPRGCGFAPRCDFFQAGPCDGGEIPMRPAGKDHDVRCARFEQIDWARHDPDVPRYARREPGEVVLNVERLSKHYAVRDRSLAAVIGRRGVRLLKANEDVSMTARRGETIAVVGESGCGKSTFAKVLMGLETATRGRVRFAGEDLAGKGVRSRSFRQISAMQMVFQNPFDTLNPSHTAGAQIMRVLTKFGVAKGRKQARTRMLELLDAVKLPREFATRRPRQLSGGQKQRIGIARAFAANPSTVVADEPVSALDVSVAAAVTSLLLELQREHDTTLVFISHDIGLVRYLADRVIVMYLGRVMEHGTTDEVFAPPYHPYTEALLAAVPIVDTSIAKRRIVLEGNVPSALDPPKGCPFASRCPRKLGQVCDETLPPTRETASGHTIACHIPLDALGEVAPVFLPREAAE